MNQQQQVEAKTRVDAWSPKLRVEDMRILAKAAKIAIAQTSNKADTIAAIMADVRVTHVDPFPQPAGHSNHYEHISSLLR
jgi:hypothetical protein